MADKHVRLSDREAAEMLEQLRREDGRTAGGMVAFLIRREWQLRHTRIETRSSTKLQAPIYDDQSAIFDTERG